MSSEIISSEKDPGYQLVSPHGEDSDIDRFAIFLLLLSGMFGRKFREETDATPKKSGSKKPPVTAHEILSGKHKNLPAPFERLGQEEQDSIRGLIARFDRGEAKISKGAVIDYQTGFLDYRISRRKSWNDTKTGDMFVLRDESLRARMGVKPNHEVYGLLDASVHFQKYMLLRWFSSIADIEDISLGNRREKAPFQNGALEFFRAFWFSLGVEKREEFKEKVGMNSDHKLMPGEGLKVMYNDEKNLFGYFMDMVRREGEYAIGYRENGEEKIYEQKGPIPLVYTQPILISPQDLEEYRKELQLTEVSL